MKTKPIFVVLVFILTLTVLAPYSFADGYIAPSVRKKLPDIPVQRALIRYEDIDSVHLI